MKQNNGVIRSNISIVISRVICRAEIIAKRNNASFEITFRLMSLQTRPDLSRIDIPIGKSGSHRCKMAVLYNNAAKNR